ncbi:MAG: DEAD/DEAH box helicase [Anaerovoracaceae bacterium]
MNINEQLASSYENGFIDCNYKSLERYNPKLLINDSKRETKVLTSIINELRTCEEFYFSVAFITESGIQSLLNTLDDITSRGIKGKIVTSQYQNFTQPKALRRLLKYDNIQLRIVTEENFHAKGYIFKHSDNYSFIIGSSNLTQNALSYNKEWNLKLSSLENGSVMKNILREYEYTFDNAIKVTDDWIDQYDKIYRAIGRARNSFDSEKENIQSTSMIKIYPNKMQTEALRHLEAIRKEGKNKALIISATGTGKTYLSAFDVAKFQPKKFLFVVHRENILNAAMQSFKKVLGYDINAGILSGNQKNYNCDYTFATIQTISKENIMKKFNENHFDYIVIDEVHRAGGETYIQLLDYFKPQFLLGMTSTPERTDGYDVFNLFDHNIAYEIRLNQALEERMLAPFHYFGITDLVVNGEMISDNTIFSRLICNERVDRIIDAVEHYNYYGERVKGLIFCSRVDEAKELSKKLNERGYLTVALSGENTEEQREIAIRKLEQTPRNDGLDYILTVDIFNEGIDIPEVNQLVMLRPTQSSIVFVQQLGRGLRKVLNKEYLTVIDFVGNYANNYMVPIALYGDRSYNKDTLIKLMNSGSTVISGCSTVNFDQITKENIYKSISNTNLSTQKDLKKDYNLMKYRLGRTPMMIDFFQQGARDPYSFISYSKGSYYDFARKVDPEKHPAMSQAKEKLLAFYSREILNVKRLDEIILLGLLKVNGTVKLDEFNAIIKQHIGEEINRNTLDSVINNLNGDFLKADDKNKYGVFTNVRVVESNNPVIIMDERYRETLCSKPLAEYLNDMILYAYKKITSRYIKDRFRTGLQLYEKYSRKDVCRLLNWDKNEESTIYGYRIKNDTCPIFVTYHKSEDVVDTQNYNDYFINSTCFSWMTRSNVNINSKEVNAIRNYDKEPLRILLFIKKNDGEGSDFYYMGDMEPIDFIETTLKNKPIVNIVFRLKDEVDESLYNYFEGEIK